MQKAFSDEQPDLEFLNQIDKEKEITDQVNSAADKPLLGFVAFEPRREDKSIDYISAGLAKGNIGVKMYPPLGYKAAGNDRDAAKLDGYFDDLFVICEGAGIPVTTHCTPRGFESIPNVSGINSAPKIWETCLRR